MADAVSFVSDLFGVWAGLFAAPFAKGNADILWIIVPIYISWALAEYYQEKTGTTTGNAISNGFVGLWVGIDWARRLVPSFAMTATFAGKAAITLFMFAYGLLIIYSGMKGRKLAVLIGRVKEVSYLMIMFSPIVYGLVPLSWNVVISIILFFPIIYGITELVDRLTPTPAEEVEPQAARSTPPEMPQPVVSVEQQTIETLSENPERRQENQA